MAEQKAGGTVSIRLLAPVVLALPVVVVSLILGALGVRQSRTAVEDLAGQIVEQIDARVGDRVARLANAAARISAQNEYLVEIGVYDPGDLRGWLPTMHRQIEVFDGLSGIAWGDRDGHATWLVDYPDEEGLEFALKNASSGEFIDLFEVTTDGVLASEARRRLEYDPRVRPWYRAGASAFESGEVAGWTDAYGWVRADGSGVTLGISYSRPVADGSGQLLGVLDTELELESVSMFLQTLRIGETGSAFIIDRAGLLVASSEGESLTDAEQERLAATAAEHEMTRGAARAAEARVGPLHEVVRPAQAHARIAGAGAWIGITPVSASGLEWVLVTVVPEADLVTRVEEARRRAGIAAFVAVLATLGPDSGWLGSPCVRS